MYKRQESITSASSDNYLLLSSLTGKIMPQQRRNSISLNYHSPKKPLAVIKNNEDETMTKLKENKAVKKVLKRYSF